MLGALALLGLALAAFFVLRQGPEAPEESLQRVQRSGRLIVGIDPSYPPFESLDAQGGLQGYDVDLARAVASELGVEAEFVSLDVGSLYEAVVAGKLDVAISSLAPALEYSDRLSFSDAYFDAGQVVMVGEGADEPQWTDHLSGRIVGVEASSEGDLRLRELAPQVSGLEVRPYSTQDALFDAFRRREVTTVVVDRVSAQMHSRREGGTVTGLSITDEPFVVITRLPDRSLTKAIHEALSDLQASGALGDLEAKWLR